MVLAGKRALGGEGRATTLEYARGLAEEDKSNYKI